MGPTPKSILSLYNRFVCLYAEKLEGFISIMRLPCDVEIQNRMLPTQGLVKRGRTTRASLVIGRRPMASNQEGSIFLSVCTAKDRDGTKYSVSIFHTLYLRYSQKETPGLFSWEFSCNQLAH